jgi:RNAse (barnase) inhibitor barstar
MILFHPSSLGNIMTAESKPIKNSETCKKELIKIFLFEKYKRKRLDVKSKYLKKGIEVENESIRIYNEMNGTKYVKNTETLRNDYLIGTPDVKDDIILEAKSNWDLDSFWDAKTTKLDTDYEWQVLGYMWLSKIKKAKLFYALCNTPYDAIQDAKFKLAREMKCIEDESEEYIEKCIMIERNSIFDMELFKFHYPYFDFHANPNEWIYDIPMSERLHVIDIPFDQDKIDRIKKRIDECREWMQTELFQTIPERIDVEGV